MIRLTTEQAQQIEEALKKTIAGCKAMGWTTVAQEQVLAAIRAARAQEQAEQEPEYKGWYCAQCERGVDGSEVTFYEQHEACGRIITDDVPPKPVQQAEQEPVAWMQIGIGDCEGTTILTARLPIEYNTEWWKFEPLYAAPQPMKQEPVALPFNCWSTNDGDSWYEHPADAQLIYDTLGDDAKVGDEFEVTAGWTCVTARYRIVSQDDDDFEVECISHPQDNANPVRTKDLTDEEQLELARSSVGKSRHWLVAAVIAAYKEKNRA